MRHAQHSPSQARAQGRPPPDAKITGPNQAAWEAFKRIDNDCSGLLDESETAELVRQLGVKGVSSRQLRKELHEMETQDPHGQISFREFALWCAA
jgi:Ca2+-binding EF-hand superfamily protein